jgi:hypothetical protein
MSRTGLHPRRPDLAGFAASRGSFASPEKRAFVSVFHRAISAPPAQHSRARGLPPQKPSPDREGSRGNQALAKEPKPGRVWVTVASLAVGGGFFWPLAPQHASACEGVRRRPGNGHCPKGVSLSACSEPPTRRSRAERRRNRCPCSRGASPSSTSEHSTHEKRYFQV